MPSGKHTLHDPAVQREPLARAVGGQMPSVLGGLGALAGVCALVDLGSLPLEARSIVAYDLITCLACLAARLAWLRFAVLRRFLHPIGALFGLLFAANTLATVALTGEMAYSSHLAVMLIAAGAFFVSVSWIVVYDVVVLMSWFVVARRVSMPAQQWAHGLALLLSAALAVLLLATRVRAYAKIALLRARDRVRGERLRTALARSRNELEQHQSARPAFQRQDIAFAYVITHRMRRIHTMQTHAHRFVANVERHAFIAYFGKFAHQRDEDVAEIQAALI